MTTIPLLCIVLLGLLGFVLGFAVSLERGKADTIIGFDADPKDPLHKIVRAHGNTMEYVPIIALLIYILAQAPQPMWVLVVMVLATLSRYIFVLGMIKAETLAKPNVIRATGAVGTYITGTLLCLAVLLMIL